MSNSHSNLDYFGTSSPASAIERPRTEAVGPAQTDEAQGRGVKNAFRRLLLRPLYGLYEIRLHRQVCTQPAPRHVGIILDGNRRYARKYGATDPHQIYTLGARKLDDVLEWCGELQIPAVTLWAGRPITSAGGPQPRFQVSLPPSRPRWRHSPVIRVSTSSGFA